MKPMAPPATTGYTGEVLPAQTEATVVTGGEAQRIQLGRDLSGEWWTLFGSLQLDALIDEAMESSPDIAAQQAALRAASENLKAENRAFFPTVEGAGNYSRA